MRLAHDSTTGEWGIQVKVENQTGGVSVKGNTVQASSATAGAAMLTVTDSINALFVIYEAGVAIGGEMWVWMNGSRAQVLMENATAVVLGDWAGCSSTAGRAYAVTGSPASAAIHDREIGHFAEANAGGTDQLVLVDTHYR